jgi:hypothetical protein
MSTIVPDSEFAATVAALQTQIHQHFAPIWDLDANLSHLTVSPSHYVNPSIEHILIMDNSDQAGALGYHLLDTGDVPQGFVFAKTCKDDGVSWSSCASHELMEQLLDPLANTAVTVNLSSAFGADANKAGVVAYEVADPVESDSYSINGVEMSNFVIPAWFVDNYDKNLVKKFDFLGKLTASLSMTTGGYMSYSTDLTNWKQVNAKTAATRPLARTNGVHKHADGHYWRRGGRNFA